MHRPEREKDAAPLADPVYSAVGTAGIWTDGTPATNTLATQVDEEYMNDWTENLFEVLARGAVAPTKGRKQDFADAIVNLVGSAQDGVVIGHFEYASASTVRLALGVEGQVAVEIDGLFPSTSVPLTFDMATNLVGSETPSTWYYAYAEDAGGTLAPHIDSVAPEMIANKIGYHPTNTSWRFIEAFYNDPSSDINTFGTSNTLNGFETRFRKWPFAVHSPGTGGTTPGIYTSVSLSGQVPGSAREVLLFIWVYGDKYGIRYTHYAIDRGLPKTTNDDGGQAVVSTESDGPEGSGSDNLWVPLHSAAAPSVAFAIRSGNVYIHEIRVLGWR